MATLEIRPAAVLVQNGFVSPGKGSAPLTQDDFPAIVDTIARAAERELGPGASLPAARAGETSRYHP